MTPPNGSFSKPILEHDPLLKGKFALNQFAGRGEVLGALPWDARTGRRFWDDNDNQGLYWYMERYCDSFTRPEQYTNPAYM